MAPRTALSGAFLLLSALLACDAALLTDPSQAAGKTYDFIIVGGGTAGAVVGNRLSEDYHVLVIEAGDTDNGVEDVQTPVRAPFASPNRAFNWNYTVVPQPNLNGRTILYPRGFILGGSSSVNYNIATRGSSDEFDRIANITGDATWSWNSMLPYAKKLETWMPPTDGRNITGQYTPDVHGYDGPIKLSLTNTNVTFYNKCIQAAKQLASIFPYNQDLNSGSPLGLGYVPATSGGGVRSSSSRYMTAAYLARPNLDLLLNTHVLSLTYAPSPSSNANPIVNGVTFSAGPGALMYGARVSKEVIVSAGALATPQLLMLSGLGPKQALQAQKITVVKDIPELGQKLQDHPWIASKYEINDTDTADSLMRSPTYLLNAETLYKTNHTGFLANGVVGAMAFNRLPYTAPHYTPGNDVSAGPKTPNIELALGAGFLPLLEDPATIPKTGNYIVIGSVLLTPSSRGSVTLASSDPFANPIIDVNFLDTDLDRWTLLEGLKLVKQLAAAPVFKDYILGPWGDWADTDTDDKLNAYIKQWTATIWHPTSTASISNASSKSGVVDPQLRVKGVSGLRIVDASVIPYVPAGHPQLPVFMIAERASDIIKSAYI